MGRTLTKKVGLTLTGLTLMIVGCAKTAEEEASVAAPRKLYVSAGLCSSGSGITTYTAATASRAVTKWNAADGSFDEVFTDLNTAASVSVGAVPQDIIDKGDHVLMLTENATVGGTGDRKIWKIYKNNPGTYISYANDPTAFSAITRSMSQGTDGSIMFSKTTAAERVNSIGARIVKGGSFPWINSTGVAGNCFTAAATLIPKIEVMAPFTGTSQGKTLYIHSGNTAALNRIGAIQRTGMTTATAADCAGSNPAGGASSVAHTNGGTLVGPVSFLPTGASLTSFAYIPTPAPATTTGKMLVTYSASVNTAFDNSANFNHGIVMWDVTEAADTTAATSVTFTNPVIIWRDDSVVFAPSTITYDPVDNSVYVAVGADIGIVNQTTRNYGYNIEKFTLDMSTPSLTRVSTNNRPFIVGNAYTKCITDISIGE